MRCPYCNIEMEKGIIESNQELSWKPGEKRRIIGRAEFHKGSVVLSELSLLKGSAVAAYICKDCKKVIIDYSNNQSDFNNR